ncbi:MAG: tetratricopeptide repeat protein [Trichodesmium sp. MAG_R01]|nr:tetratricopeptide repeat protein [Trichodesmium sp. MAG_R01]
MTSVVGMGGIGKTELALQYAHFHLKQKTYKGGICWLDCRGENVGLQIVGFTNSQFNLQISEEYDLQTRINLCWRNWPQGDVLIIFDDVVDYNVIKDCIPPGNSRFKTIITTRKKWLGQSFEKLELEALDLTSALDLLISFVGNNRINSELQEAEELCKDLGFLPLGLELVARYLERKEKLSLAKMRQRLELKHNSLEDISPDMTAQRGARAAFELSWDKLDEDSKKLSYLLSLFAPAPIPWNLVEQCFSEVDEEDLEDRRDELINSSLLKCYEKDNYSLHPLIREFFINKLSGLDFVEEMKQNICQIITGTAGTIPNYITIKQAKEIEINIPHIKAIADNLSEYLSDEDLTTAFTRLGSFYISQGLYPLAQPWLEKGKEIAEKRLNKNNPDIATVYIYIANLYELQGKYEAAEPLYLQAIEIDKIALPENHPSIARDLNNLASLYREQGKYEEAEHLFLQAIEIDKIALPENHPPIARDLNNLASLYREQGKYEEAEHLFLQAIEINKIALPENHPSIAEDLNNLANLYNSQGKHEEAEPLYLQAIEIDKIDLPENHPSIARDLNNLAVLYYSQGKHEEAETLSLQAIEIHKTALPKNHPQLAIYLNNLALLYYAQGKYEEAEPLFLQAIEIDKITLPKNHPSIARNLNNLAGLYCEQGKYKEAEPLFLQAIEIFKQSLGEEHSDTQTVIKNYQLFLNEKNE